MKPLIVIDDKQQIINEPNAKLNILIDRVLASQYSDSNLYRGSITSIKYILGDVDINNNLSELRQRLINELTIYLKRYFDFIIVECDILLENEDKKNDKYVIILNINAKDTDGNIIAKLNKTIRFKRSTLTLVNIENIDYKEYNVSDANTSIL